MTSSDFQPVEAPRVSVTQMQHLMGAHLSLPSRVGHALLLVVSLTMATAVGSLWATEPSLPLRTHVAFAVIVAIALAWAAFATWVLARRRVLFGRDRVVAARMGLLFAALATAGMLVVGYWTGAGTPVYIGALVEGLLGVVAGVLLVRAQRRVEVLSRRKQELERQFAASRP